MGTYLAWGVNNNGWWGEREIKFYLDGDWEFLTICGTGTEDYFCGDCKKQKIPRVAGAGPESGRMTFQYIANGPQPSNAAASSKSRGIPMKNRRSMKVP